MAKKQKRKAISNRARFEVFKRDRFTCQYCGNHPPAVRLHVDHFIAVANGGDNDNDNLITSCENCNLGKGAKPLSDVPQSLRDKSADIAEREAQLSGYQSILAKKRQRLDDESWEIAEVFSPGCSKTGFNRDCRLSIKRFLEQLGFDAVLESSERAVQKRPYSPNQAFKYFCGICWNKIKESQGRQ